MSSQQAPWERADQKEVGYCFQSPLAECAVARSYSNSLGSGAREKALSENAPQEDFSPERNIGTPNLTKLQSILPL